MRRHIKHDRRSRVINTLTGIRRDLWEHGSQLRRHHLGFPHIERHHRPIGRRQINRQQPATAQNRRGTRERRTHRHPVEPQPARNIRAIRHPSTHLSTHEVDGPIRHINKRLRIWLRRVGGASKTGHDPNNRRQQQPRADNSATRPAYFPITHDESPADSKIVINHGKQHFLRGRTAPDFREWPMAANHQDDRISRA